jgi:hypothetical protein
MKNRISKHSGRTNTLLASLVLRRGIIGAASQWLVHTMAYASGRQSGQRTCAGIRRTLPH